MAEILCLVSLILAFFCGRRSLGAGLVAVLAVGYAYGIVRANVPATASHFIFDSAALGLYAGVFTKPVDRYSQFKSATLQPWVVGLAAWPLLLFFIPVQDWLVQLVGLRGTVFFLPFILIGTRLKKNDLFTFATGVALLNIAALGFALAEFTFGVARFFPHNAVTELIFRSNDVAGGAFRIPATFGTSAAYGGTMVVTIPFLAGVWAHCSAGLWRRRLLELAMLSAAFGVFLCASRTCFVMLFCLAAVIFMSVRFKPSHKVGLVALGLIVAWQVAKDPRLQRFTTLADTGMVKERVSWSVNTSFADALMGYPMGNGLGGGGTSLPYFMESRVRNLVAIENEYGRILLEQGLPGLMLWVGFILWFLRRSWPEAKGKWYLGQRMLWTAIAASFVDGLLGTGLLTSIPYTSVLLLGIGWLVGQRREQDQARSRASQPNCVRSLGSVPTY
jgi:hypothetical protein